VRKRSRESCVRAVADKREDREGEGREEGGGERGRCVGGVEGRDGRAREGGDGEERGVEGGGVGRRYEEVEGGMGRLARAGGR
jgi:hypothetical protein